MRLSFIAKFSLLSLISIIIVGLILGWGISKQIEKGTINQAISDASFLSRNTLDHHFAPEDFKEGLTPQKEQEIDELLSKHSDDDQIILVKIWNREGKIVYSTDKKLTNQKFPLSEGLKKAFRNKIWAKVEVLEGEEHRAEVRKYSRLIEVYTPLHSYPSQKVIGSYEIYFSVSNLLKNIAYTKRLLWLILLGGFSVLYLSLFGIVRNASRALVEKKELEKANVRLQKSLAERKEAEEALKQSERRYRMLFNSGNDAVFVTHLTSKGTPGRFIEVNDVACKRLVYSRDELLEKSPADIADVESIDTKGVMEKLHRDKHIIFEAIHIAKDGRRIPVEISSQLFKLNGHSTVLSIARDITRRKKAEEEINSLIKFPNENPNPVLRAAKDGTLLYTNHASKPLLDEWNCQPNQFLPDDIRQWVSESFEFNTNTEKEIMVGNRAFSVMFTPVIGESYVFIYALDVTDRTKAEEALQESEKRYRTLVETSAECICSLDLNGYFLYMSPAGLKSHGMTLDEVKGTHCTELAKPAYSILLKKTLAEAKKGGSVRFQYESETITGSRWFESTLTPVRDISGKVTSLLRITRDITETKEATERIKQSLEKLNRTFEETVNSLASMAEKRDPYTAGHQKRVSALASAIAKEMNLPEDLVTGIRVAGLLHDIGKVNVPAEILSKPSRLSEIEFKLIKTHPEVGCQVLKTIEFPWPIAQIVLQHHERIDGSGYPLGLFGEDISLGARILGVADVVEAMASHRPYRPALDIDKALQEISMNKGVLYDAKAVDACLELFAKKRFKFDKLPEDTITRLLTRVS